MKSENIVKWWSPGNPQVPDKWQQISSPFAHVSENYQQKMQELKSQKDTINELQLNMKHLQDENSVLNEKHSALMNSKSNEGNRV